jgi:pimeloyl-ACP methyl ester carboxylesterase
MSQDKKQGTVIARIISARGWRRYVGVGLVVVLGTFGTVAAVSATAAPTTHGTSSRGTSTYRLPAHSVWLRHQTAGLAGLVARTGTKTPRVASNFSPPLAGFTQGQVAVPGASIHYVMGGSGPVLVLLHGWPMTWWEWHTVMPSLAQTHTVVAFDLPGLGQSTAPSGDDFTAVTTAQILHEAVQALGLSDISILSHDLGVNVAYAYAKQFPVEKLGVMESMINGFGLESIYGFSFHFLLNMTAPPTAEDIVNNVASEVAYLNYMYLFAENPANITAVDRATWYAAYASPTNRSDGYDYYRAFPENEAWNLANNTTELTMPVLAMGGDDSLGPLVAQSMEQVATDVHEVIVANSGHYIPEEQPAFLAECANLFFSSATTAPAGFEDCLSS